jgi:beta-glucosidase
MTPHADTLRFPEGFPWGAATSAYQIEGSPLADGGAPSIQHRFAHTPGNTVDGSTGDVAAESGYWYRDVMANNTLEVGSP